MMKSQLSRRRQPLLSRTSSSSDRTSEADEQAEQNASSRSGSRDSPGASAARGPVAGRRAHSYTCRYLRTNRIAIMFISSVITKAASPTAKIVLYSMLPVGTSPLPIGGDERGHRLDRLARVGGQLRLTWPAAIEHDHRLADGARDAEHERRRRCPTARPGRRPAVETWSSVRAEPEGALAQRPRARRTSRPRTATRPSAGS